MMNNANIKAEYAVMYAQNNMINTFLLKFRAIMSNVATKIHKQIKVITITDCLVLEIEESVAMEMVVDLLYS